MPKAIKNFPIFGLNNAKKIILTCITLQLKNILISIPMVSKTHEKWTQC